MEPHCVDLCDFKMIIVICCVIIQPGNYLSHLIGHEGPGSLLSELKSRGKEQCNYVTVILKVLFQMYFMIDRTNSITENLQGSNNRVWQDVGGRNALSFFICIFSSFPFTGWVNTLSAGHLAALANGFMFFRVNVDLSEEGIGKHAELLNTLRRSHNGWHLTDDIFNFISSYENCWVSIEISRKFVLKGLINNKWSQEQHNPNNYRPTSRLGVIKIQWKMSYNQVLGFLKQHEIMYDYQFGFR